jgi:hypothetical protein
VAQVVVLYVEINFQCIVAGIVLGRNLALEVYFLCTKNQIKMYFVYYFQ